MQTCHFSAKFADFKLKYVILRESCRSEEVLRSLGLAACSSLLGFLSTGQGEKGETCGGVLRTSLGCVREAAHYVCSGLATAYVLCAVSLVLRQHLNNVSHTKILPQELKSTPDGVIEN